MAPAVRSRSNSHRSNRYFDPTKYSGPRKDDISDDDVDDDDENESDSDDDDWSLLLDTEGNPSDRCDYCTNTLNLAKMQGLKRRESLRFVGECLCQEWLDKSVNILSSVEMSYCHEPLPLGFFQRIGKAVTSFFKSIVEDIKAWRKRAKIKKQIKKAKENSALAINYSPDDLEVVRVDDSVRVNNANANATTNTKGREEECSRTEKRKNHKNVGRKTEIVHSRNASSLVGGRSSSNSVNTTHTSSPTRTNVVSNSYQSDNTTTPPNSRTVWIADCEGNIIDENGRYDDVYDKDEYDESTIYVMRITSRSAFYEYPVPVTIRRKKRKNPETSDDGTAPTPTPSLSSGSLEGDTVTASSSPSSSTTSGEGYDDVFELDPVTNQLRRKRISTFGFSYIDPNMFVEYPSLKGHMHNLVPSSPPPRPISPKELRRLQLHRRASQPSFLVPSFPSKPPASSLSQRRGSSPGHLLRGSAGHRRNNSLGHQRVSNSFDLVNNSSGRRNNNSLSRLASLSSSSLLSTSSSSLPSSLPSIPPLSRSSIDEQPASPPSPPPSPQHVLIRADMHSPSFEHQHFNTDRSSTNIDNHNISQQPSHPSTSKPSSTSQRRAKVITATFTRSNEIKKVGKDAKGFDESVDFEEISPASSYRSCYNKAVSVSVPSRLRFKLPTSPLVNDITPTTTATSDNTSSRICRSSRGSSNKNKKKTTSTTTTNNNNNNNNKGAAYHAATESVVFQDISVSTGTTAESQSEKTPTSQTLSLPSLPSSSTPSLPSSSPLSSSRPLDSDFLNLYDDTHSNSSTESTTDLGVGVGDELNTDTSSAPCPSSSTSHAHPNWSWGASGCFDNISNPPASASVTVTSTLPQTTDTLDSSLTSQIEINDTSRDMADDSSSGSDSDTKTIVNQSGRSSFSSSDSGGGSGSKTRQPSFSETVSSNRDAAPNSPRPLQSTTTNSPSMLLDEQHCRLSPQSPLCHAETCPKSHDQVTDTTSKSLPNSSHISQNTSSHSNSQSPQSLSQSAHSRLAKTYPTSHCHNEEDTTLKSHSISSHRSEHTFSSHSHLQTLQTQPQSLSQSAPTRLAKTCNLLPCPIDECQHFHCFSQHCRSWRHLDSEKCRLADFSPVPKHYIQFLKEKNEAKAPLLPDTPGKACSHVECPRDFCSRTLDSEIGDAYNSIYIATQFRQSPITDLSQSFDDSDKTNNDNNNDITKTKSGDSVGCRSSSGSNDDGVGCDTTTTTNDAGCDGDSYYDYDDQDEFDNEFLVLDMEEVMVKDVQCGVRVIGSDGSCTSLKSEYSRFETSGDSSIGSGSPPADNDGPSSYQHGTLTRPQEGQSLISYLISQDFNTCANMEKENAHFHISEALIAAFESMQWNQTMKKKEAADMRRTSSSCSASSHSSASSSDEEIQELRQRIRIRKREKLMERGHNFPSVSDDTEDGTIEDMSPPGSTTPQGMESEEEEEHKEIDMTLSAADDMPAVDEGAEAGAAGKVTPSNLQAMASKGLNLSMASLYSETELQRSNQQAQQKSLSQQEEAALTAGSAESVAISLLKKFSEKNLPKASELKWLVSERDAPQRLLPLPSSIPVSPDDADNTTTTTQTRLRGNLEWAPPRAQIIFSIHPSEKRSVVLARQNHRCAGCGTRVDPAYAKRYRYCEYLGKYFCQCCHGAETSVIPGRVIERWDFTRYPISNFSFNLLEKMWAEPLFHIDNVNPNLYRRVRGLDAIRDGRQQLIHLHALLVVCKRDNKLLNEIRSLPAHWLESDNVYSMDDFAQVKSGQMLMTIKSLVTTARHHVAECQLCQGLGFICGMCKNTKVIFPFQLNTVIKCPVCQSCYHKECFVAGKCPKCIRMEARRKQQQQPLSPMSPQSSPEWHGTKNSRQKKDDTTGSGSSGNHGNKPTTPVGDDTRPKKSPS